ncbi:mediator complex, subunit Med18 [Dendryphion nanum]|uniref:Mediator of RNA polymerase II transcription subunit 18 n=1 Tax=Dendryphion nanum TaxID=256645 RepID=A0A9P9DU34_9PLEO|nr:mediator complex, subunit Med18 [Dendryphion nanum]
MHELLLYGQVSEARHEQVLKVLAGIAAMQPHRVLRRHIVYKPQREPDEPGSHLKRGGTQAVAQKNATKQVGQKPLFFTQLIQHLSDDDFDRTHAEKAEGNSLDVGKDDAGLNDRWSYEWHDIPDPADRGVLVRQMLASNGLKGNAHAYSVALGNQFVSEYYIEGHRFVYENLVIFLHRILHEPGARSLETTPKETLPSLSALHPLDPSGAYILEAKIRVQDLNDPNLVDQGVEELKSFQNQMKGCVQLYVPDRLNMDTRVKWVPKPIGLPRKVQVAPR